MYAPFLVKNKLDANNILYVLLTWQEEDEEDVELLDLIIISLSRQQATTTATRGLKQEIIASLWNPLASLGSLLTLSLSPCCF